MMFIINIGKKECCKKFSILDIITNDSDNGYMDYYFYFATAWTKI